MFYYQLDNNKNTEDNNSHKQLNTDSSPLYENFSAINKIPINEHEINDTIKSVPETHPVYVKKLVSEGTQQPSKQQMDEHRQKIAQKIQQSSTTPSHIVYPTQPIQTFIEKTTQERQEPQKQSITLAENKLHPSEVYVDMQCFLGNMDKLKQHSKDMMINYDVLMSGVDSCTYMNTDSSLEGIEKKEEFEGTIEKFNSSNSNSNSNYFETVKFIILFILLLYILTIYEY